MVLKTAFDPEDILQTIEREKVTAAHFAPLMIQRMLDVLDTKSYDVSTLRIVHYASAPMPVPCSAARSTGWVRSSPRSTA